MSGKRVVRVRKKRRLRKRRVLLAGIIVLLLSIVSYSSFQFVAGQNLGSENGGIGNSDENKEKTEQFENRQEYDFEEPEDKKINILFVGSDQREEEVSRTDTIMIGQYDTESGEAKLVSIMRDTFVEIPEYGYNKINASYAIGDVALLTETIESNFGVPIDHYAVVNFNGFKDIINTIAPSGIEMDVEKRMQYQSGSGDVNIDLYPGEQMLDGEELLNYARFRSDSESDFGRVRRQQQVMSALKEEMLSFSSVPSLPKTAGLLTSYIATDMTNTEIMNYGRKFLLDPPENMETKRIPVEGSYTNERIEGKGAVLSHNEEQNRQAIQEFLNGTGATANTETESTNEESISSPS
ncbi:LCP family protein [Pontibacillus salicampi]|uniref:Regulatory protein MsrR n=1 Tax=Pontibacillus salicampi TaxID=1449801 RepID=A0ABV6LQU4_9BACI